MLKTGAALLLVWCGLNCLVGLGVTAVTLVYGTPPALELMMNADEIHALDARAIAVVNAQALIANPLIIAVCVLCAVLTWKVLLARQEWAWWALAGTLIPVLAFGFLSDSRLGDRNLAANVVSSLIVVSSLGLTFLGLRRKRMPAAA